MGGSAIGGASPRAALGDRASRPIVVARDYALPAWTTPGHHRAVRQLLGRHRGDAGLPTRPPARWARARIVSTTGGELAERRPRRRRPGDPVARRLPAARRGRLRAGRGARGARRLPARRRALHTEIDVAAAHAEQLVAEWGPDAPEDSLAKALARALHGTSRDRRRRA